MSKTDRAAEDAFFFHKEKVPIDGGLGGKPESDSDFVIGRGLLMRVNPLLNEGPDSGLNRRGGQHLE